MGPAPGAFGFAQAVSKTAVESARKVWMVFMRVFLKEWGSRRGRQQNGNARQETGRHQGDPDGRSALRNGCEAVYNVRRWGRAAMGDAMCAGLFSCTRI